MNRFFKFWIKNFLLVFVLAGIFTSCVPQKKIKYLQRQQSKDTTSFYPNQRMSDRRVQPKDNLYIRVYTLDEKAFMYFNKISGTSSYNDFANDASIYLNSYNVANDGNISFPIIGKVYVKDLTVEGIKDTLQKRINEYLRETMVVVKMVNFKITLVGEVARPGQYSIYKDDITVFEALSLAGDMTEFANRKNVALIRQTNGGSTVFYLNMTSSSVLTSNNYYLQPNDIIYIAPLGYKRWGLGTTFPWLILLSTVTTTLLLINYFK